MKSDRMPLARWFLPLPAAFALVATSSCGMVEPGPEMDEEKVSDQEELIGSEEFLPALEFDRSSAYTQPGAGGGSSSVDIHGPAVVHANEGVLKAHDVVNDNQLWVVSTEHGEAAPRSVEILEHGEKVMAVGAFETVRPGSGTTRDTPMREVLAVDLLSGETLWHNVTETDKGFLGRVIGLAGDSVILSGQGTQAFDAHDGSPLWADEEVMPHLVDDSGVVVAGSEDSGSDLYDVNRLHGLDAETGERMWETWEEGDHETYSSAAREEYSAFLDTDPEPGEMVMAHGSLNGYDLSRVRSAGPGRFYVIASYTEEPWNLEIGGGTIALFDTATGVADYSINHDPLTSGIRPRLGWGEASCSYDQETSLACWAEDPGITLVNIDVEAGGALWAEQFSRDSERRVIEPVSAWNGVLYARVGGEPIILDLEDGSDLVLDPGVAPDLTNGTVAVEYVSESGPFQAYPVTG